MKATLNLAENTILMDCTPQELAGLLSLLQPVPNRLSPLQTIILMKRPQPPSRSRNRIQNRNPKHRSPHPPSPSRIRSPPPKNPNPSSHRNPPSASPWAKPSNA